MWRYVVLAAAVSIFCRWALGKWPWDYLRPAPTRSQAVLRARKLLGIEAGASREEIITAHRRLTALVHPDRGGTLAAGGDRILDRACADTVAGTDQRARNRRTFRRTSR